MAPRSVKVRRAAASTATWKEGSPSSSVKVSVISQATADEVLLLFATRARRILFPFSPGLSPHQRHKVIATLKESNASTVPHGRDGFAKKGQPRRVEGREPCESTQLDAIGAPLARENRHWQPRRATFWRRAPPAGISRGRVTARQNSIPTDSPNGCYSSSLSLLSPPRSSACPSQERRRKVGSNALALEAGIH